MKENKGITLVALIITIIVMMILVAVSVAVIINSDLLGTAKNAGESYKAKAGEEGNLSGDDVQIIVGDKTYDSLDAYKQTLNQTQTICSHASFNVETDDECPDCGAEKIQFSVDNSVDDETYWALEGMDWEAWIGSSLSPELTLSNGYGIDGGDVIRGEAQCIPVLDGEAVVKGTDKIRPITYHLDL